MYLLLFHYILQEKGDYFFIISRLGESEVVMDVDKFKMNPGTPIICYPKKHPPANNQLWTKVHGDGNTFYIASKLGSSCKLRIQVIICISLYTIIYPCHINSLHAGGHFSGQIIES